MLKACPQEIINELTAVNGKRRNKRPSFITGQRNQSVASITGSLVRAGASEGKILAEVLALNDNSPNPLDHDEVIATVNSISKHQPSDDTEVAAAAKFATLHHEIAAYVPSYGWMTYDGVRWIKDEDELNVQQLVKDFVAAELVEARSEADSLAETEAKILIKRAKNLQTKTKVNNIATLAKSDPLLKVPTDQLDGNNQLFNCLNGTFNLSTLSLQPHDPADRLTKLAQVEFIPKAKSPEFDKFMDGILSPSHQSFFLRLMGATLLGNPVDQVFPIIHGSGKNGKSTLFNICLSIFHDYAATVEPETLLASKKNGARNDIARLVAKRLVVTTETPQGGILDAAMIKRLSGNDTITARLLYKEHFEFKPQFIPIMLTNHLPVMNGSDSALARRVIAFHFAKVIPDNETDMHLGVKLEAEKSGIFNRIIEGLKDYEKNGLNIPEDIKAATQAYVDQSNIMKSFIDDKLTKEPGAKLRASHLHDIYRWWMSDNGYKPLSSSQFKTEFQRVRGTVSARDNMGIYWPNIKVV